jgi:LysM repeat protein
MVSVPTATPALPTPTVLARHPLVLAATTTARPTATSAARSSVTPGPTVALATATAAANLAAGPHTLYVVHAGDTLDGIAHRLGIAPSVLADMNHLAPPYKIVVGKSLLVPAV